MEAWEVLPLEVWALVLRQPPLVPADLARAACVCRALHQLIGPFVVSPSSKSSSVWASASARQWRLVAAREAHPILTLALGSCGAQVAAEYWLQVVAEHDLSGSADDEVANVRLSDHSLYGLGTHFRHTEQGKPSRSQAWTITLY